MVIQCWLEQGVSPPWGHPSIRTPGMSIPSSLPTGMLQTLQTEQETWLQLGRAGPQCWQDDAFCLPLVGRHWSLPNKKKVAMGQREAGSSLGDAHGSAACLEDTHLLGEIPCCIPTVILAARRKARALQEPVCNPGWRQGRCLQAWLFLKRSAAPGTRYN